MANMKDVEQEPAGGLLGLWRGWEQFWFAPGDPTTLGFMRLVGGVLIFYVHLAYSFDLQTFMGADAWLRRDTVNYVRSEMPVWSPPATWDKASDVVPQNERGRRDLEEWSTAPNQVVDRGRHIFSIWFHITDPVQMRWAHGIVLLCIFLFAIGFCTRVTSVLTWVALLSYINRSHISVFGIDTMMTILTTYLVIGPSGAAFSVDRLIERRLAARRGHPIAPWQPADPSVTANLALRLLQIHFCVVYLISGLSKLQGGMWWQGLATWGTMANYEFSPMNSHLYMEYLRWLCSSHWLWETVLTATSAMTLILECTFMMLVWNKKLRWLYVSGAALFHVNIAIFMGLFCFSIVMLAFLLCFVPGVTIREVLRSFFDRRQRASAEAAQTLRAPPLHAASPALQA
jgi:Vitamin K-dependent gamma-carboxylase